MHWTHLVTTAVGFHYVSAIITNLYERKKSTFLHHTTLLTLITVVNSYILFIAGQSAGQERF